MNFLQPLLSIQEVVFTMLIIVIQFSRVGATVKVRPTHADSVRGHRVARCGTHILRTVHMVGFFIQRRSFFGEGKNV